MQAKSDILKVYCYSRKTYNNYVFIIVQSCDVRNTCLFIYIYTFFALWSCTTILDCNDVVVNAGRRPDDWNPTLADKHRHTVESRTESGALKNVFQGNQQQRQTLFQYDGVYSRFLAGPLYNIWKENETAGTCVHNIKSYGVYIHIRYTFLHNITIITREDRARGAVYVYSCSVYRDPKDPAAGVVVRCIMFESIFSLFFCIYVYAFLLSRGRVCGVCVGR